MKKSEHKYEIVSTAQFRKEYRLAKKRGHNMKLLDDLADALARGEKLPAKNKDHALGGRWTGHRECHIQPNWLLIYRLEKDVLVLTQAHTWGHSSLFPN